MYSKAEVIDFIKTYGALILSVIAIVQVWVIALVKKYRKGKIDIFETAWIEIGLAGFGPAINLNGTLRAHRKDVFVHEVSLHLIRESDGAAFQLGWIAFKAPQMKIGDPMATTVELPSGIIVREGQPFRYSIVFCDKQVFASLQRQLSLVLNEWKQFVEERQAKIQKALKTTNENSLSEQLFREFVQASETVQSTLDFHESVNWWKAGKYRIRMDVKASSPDKTFSEEWAFLLDEESCEKLRANTMATLREVCLGKLEYFSVNADYMPTGN